MAKETPRPGRLIAIDGSRGADVATAAGQLVDALKRRGVECVVSRWDASGLFGELAQAGTGIKSVSPRTLSLVYAADLAFRLRWEVRPVLESGGIVIAAAYVETAIAFGASCDLPEQWLRELMRFAPQPDVQALARERKRERAWKARLDRGYAEYCAALFVESAPKLLSRKTRGRVMARLEAARGRRVFSLSGDGIDRAAKAVTNNRPGGSSRASSRPRTARK
jgi:thymidylate kinase